jgi:L-lactate dehydrogenase (cytochrome)
VNLSEYINSQFDPTLSWKDIAWFRDHWSGPIVLKGIQRVDDAVLAAESGVEAVALSNHGGRQLDGAPPPIELVAPVREAVGARIAVICDGGVRRGSDIAKAISLGADACMIGRGYLFGLGAAGEAGVDHALEHFRSGLVRTMALLGASDIDELTDDLVSAPASPRHS